MTNNRKTADDMAAKFIELLETAKSTDDLRQQGVPERMIETFEAIMRREGLDPERPADLRVMLGRMIDTAYQRLMD